ncbi:MAG: RsmE family RNA methyltransferase [Gemmatimonadetes bacterium]|nr:RsmE family RNA methyltransferase [Gemmatimonadota bacterium]
MSLPTFVTDDPFTAPGTVTLGEDAAHHMRVRRLESGVRVGLVDGAGTRGEGVLTQLAKRHAIVSVESAERVAAAPAVHLLVPVADKDRMLWLAEKATELSLTSWRPVLYRRSKHVNPRGEGTTFQQKVRSRMAGALEQSHGAWLPVTFPEASLEHAIAGRPPGVAYVLDQGARPLFDALGPALEGPRRAGQGIPAVTLAVGPEGGFEPTELATLEASGFARVSLARNVLRFETAALAGLVAVRATLDWMAATFHDAGAAGGESTT